MIWNVFRISWLNLMRDRLALALSFLLPLVFFSIFAAVFGGMGRGSPAPVATVLVVADRGPLGSRLAEELSRSEELRLIASDAIATGEAAADRAAARELVRRGRATVAVIVPEGFSRGFAAGARVEVLADLADPLAVERVGAELQRAAVAVAGDFAGAAAGAPALLGRPGLEVRVDDVLGGGEKDPSIAYFAAGIGVLFLLFAVSGRSAILIEEKETGVLVRILASRLRLSQLLAGRWLFLTLLGFVQVSLMFVWGALAFGLDLFTPRHLAGFAVLTAVTAAAAAGFGLVLATACRTRAQLNGVSSVVILIMSALGGSMFPRFLMPESLRALGLFTFNAWALDGYQKIFWYEATPPELAPQLAVLTLLAAAFLVLARLLARRWERV